MLGTLRRLRLEGVLASPPSRERALVVALIVARILDPRPKLATARGFAEESAFTTLAEALGVEGADEDELYEALDWLGKRQGRIEGKLAHRHLAEGTLVLYDLTTTYFEGRTCPLARRGRPGEKQGKLEIVIGLVCTPEGCPVAVEVFAGNTSDPETVGATLDRIQKRFGLKRIVMVGDRGMITDARIDQELRPRGVDWITSLRAPTIRKLYKEGPLQLSLFDERDLAEIRSPDFPGERLVCCRNPLLAEDRARKRQELLEATQPKLEAIVEATRREKRPLRGKDRIGVRVGRVLEKSKVGKHFRYEITEESFSFERDEASIAEEAALDGIYVVRTNVAAAELGAEEVVRAYKGLSEIEQAFRILKDFALEVEPIRHRKEDRVRAHVFLCMLAYYVRKHMEQALAPLLLTDHDREGARARRASILAPARRSEAGERKIRRQQTDEGEPARSFQTLLQDLKTLTKNQTRVEGSELTFEKYARPTPLQQKAFDLLGVSFRM